VKRFFLIWLLFLTGCLNVQPAIDNAAKAETRIGVSGETALNSIAAASSKLTIILADIHSGITASRDFGHSAESSILSTLANVSDISSQLRDKFEQPTHYWIYIIGVGTFLLLLHAIFTIWKMKILHDDIRQINKSTLQ